MITNKLKIEISSLLLNADQIWVAVALVKESALDFLQTNLKTDCIQHYLVGIDLPTPPSVLKKLQSKQEKGVFECAIYNSSFNFHPKVYVIKTVETYTAFIGSSNLTDGGFENNIELNYKITNQEDCLSILNWFNLLFKEGYPLNEENISAYESQFESVKDIEEQIKRTRKAVKLKKTASINSSFDEIDFSDRYFKKEHHLAFRKEHHYSDSDQSIAERESAKNKCIELHDNIFPLFKDYGIGILQPNPMPDHLISMIRQIDPTKPRAINAMWLSYGKNEKEIKEYQKLVGPDQKAKQTFIHHARLQIRIDDKNIGIWLLFAKENEGGLFDREYFKGEMRNREYREKFFRMAKSLPTDYFISVGDYRQYLHLFKTAEELHEFCKKDHIQKYFIIGKDYKITDEEMSETNLPTETLKVFKLLFPFYEMMRHKII